MTDKIDTQGQSGDFTNNPMTVRNRSPYEYPIRDVPKRTAFTDQERSELKEIIKEALQEFHNHRL